MRITQGCFSFLPDLTDDQILTQIQYCLDNDWAMSLEYTDDPHPRNTYWEMWGLPMFDLNDATGVMMELNTCRKVSGDSYISLSAFDSSHGWNRSECPSSSTGRRTKRVPPRPHRGPRPRAALCDARLCDRPAGRKALRMNEGAETKPAAPAKINLAEEFAQSGVGPVLQQLDDELIGLAPVKRASARSRRCCWSIACGKIWALFADRRPCT